MSGRPIRRRLLADIAHAGGWPVVLERIASGETVTRIARSFNVSRSFFARLLHEDRDRHVLVTQARKAAADALAEVIAEQVAAKQDVKDLGTELRAEIAELRAEMRTEFADVRAELHAEIADLRNEMRTEFAAVRTELQPFEMI